MSFAIGYLIALLAFWFLTTLHFEWSLMAFTRVFSGAFLPLWFLPPWLAGVANLLPFRYLGFVPVALYLGRIPPQDMAGTFLLWAVAQLGIALNPLTLLYLVLAVAGTACLQAAMLVLLGSLAFVIIRSGYLMGLYYTLKGFVSYPLTLYGVGIQWLLTLVVPLAFVNFYPAALLLGKGGAVLPPAEGWAAPLVGPALLLLAYVAFTRGVARYQGAGG